MDWGPGQHQKRVPIRSAGRFAHEAVDIDPGSGILYQTEDNFDFPSGFYRYIAPQNPMQVRELRDGGKLEMLKVKGVQNAVLDKGQTPGVTYDVEWVTIDQPDTTFAPGTTNNQAIVFVGNQGRAKGAAIFSRLEGIFFDSGKIYLVSTQGGDTPAGEPPRPATATVSGSCGPTTRRRRRSPSCSNRRVEPCSSSPTTSASVRRGPRSSARTARPRLPARRPAGRRDLRLRAQRDPAEDGRGVRRRDVLPRRQGPVRQHPGELRPHLRDLGPMEKGGALGTATRRALGTGPARPCAGHPSFRRRSGGPSFRAS